MPLVVIPGNATPEQIARLLAEAERVVRVTGAGIKPNPPRNLIPQGGSRKVILTWDAPEDDIAGGGYRIYKNSERTVYKTINDPECRTCEVSVSAGSPSPVNNFFVTRVDGSGVESAPVFVQGRASTEAGAPADPPPPAGSPTGGGGGRSRLPCFSGNTEVKTLGGAMRFDVLPEVFMGITEFGPRMMALIKHRYVGKLLDMGGGEGVTYEHLMKIGGAWRPAREKWSAEFDYDGYVYNAHVITDSDDERHYILQNGETAHNMKALDVEGNPI
jgi:hypothetical protein